VSDKSIIVQDYLLI